eukprot:scaffold15271_cov110-Isochrysis_galbana.AAC.5
MVVSDAVSGAPLAQLNEPRAGAALRMWSGGTTAAGGGRRRWCVGRAAWPFHACGNSRRKRLRSFSRKRKASDCSMSGMVTAMKSRPCGARRL